MVADKIEYSLLVPCLSKAKQMYKMLLREKQQFIAIEDFIVELKAAQIDEAILKYILQNESRSKIDFIDYLTFFPLFLHTHSLILDSVMTSDKA